MFIRNLWSVLGVVVMAAGVGADPVRVYIGTYTGGASEGIYVLSLDRETGTLGAPVLAAAVENPSFLAMHPDRPLVYAAGESGAPGIPGGAVSAFAVDEGTGQLPLINQESSQGGGACHVAVAPSGKHVAVANYGGGSVALLPVREDGGLGPACAFHQHAGGSVNPQRQEGPHAHSVNFDAAGRFLFVADLGTDEIFVYAYDAEAGTLTLNEPPVKVAPGAGPRHFSFHPEGKLAWVVNEMGNTVTGFRYDGAGSLSEVGTIGTLPAGFAGESTTAEIRVHPGGRYLYVSNRGHDSITGFAIDAVTGKLTLAGHTPTGGKTPRNFAIDPTGRYLLAANQNSDSLVLFRVDGETGGLTATGTEVSVGAPVCVLFQARNGELREEAGNAERGVRS